MVIPEMWFCFTFPQSLCGPWWTWSYGGWIYNYLCNQCPSSLKLSLNPVHVEVF